HQHVEKWPPGDVALDDGERLVQGSQGPDVLLLDDWIVKIIQIVDGPDRMALLQEPLAHMRPDKPRPAGNQKIHGRTLTEGFQSSRLRAKWLQAQIVNNLNL